MPYFIKAGYWAKLQKGFKGWLNLDDIMGGAVYPYSVLASADLVGDPLGATLNVFSGSSFTPEIEHEPIDVKVILSNAPVDGIQWYYTSNGAYYDITITGIINSVANVKIVVL